MDPAASALPAVPTEGLGPFERAAVAGMTRWNHSKWANKLTYAFVHVISHTWIQASMSNRLQVTGGEHVRDLKPPRGVLLVANHRTFWDLYVITSVLTTHTRFARQYYFPVRARFFYTNPVGVLVNLGVSGGSMWPPIFDGFDRLGRNAAALGALATLMGSPGALAGIHPEGTRNKGPDPFAMLPAKGGAGRLVQKCHPDVLVLPCFLTGLTNDLPREVLRNFKRPEHRGPPIQVGFGAPVRVGDLDTDVAPVELARDLLARVAEVGARLPPC